MIGGHILHKQQCGCSRVRFAGHADRQGFERVSGGGDDMYRPTLASLYEGTTDGRGLPFKRWYQASPDERGFTTP